MNKEYSIVCFTALTAMITHLFTPNLAMAQSADFQVTLKTGKLIRAAAVELVKPKQGLHYLMVDDYRHELKDVRSFETVDGYFVRSRIDKNTYESLLERIIKGEISLFKLSVVQLSDQGASLKHKLNYFQYQDQDIQRVKLGNLKAILSSNLDSKPKVSQVKLINLIGLSGFLAGSGMIVAGLTSTDEGEDISASPWFYAGLAMITVPLWTKKTKEKKLLEGIQLYNSN